MIMINLTSYEILIQIALLFIYSVYFYMLGRVFQKKTKLFIGSISSSLFMGFILFILITYLSLTPLIILGANLQSIIIVNLIKDIIIGIFILFNYQNWMWDFKFLNNKINIQKTFFAGFCLILTIIIVYFLPNIISSVLPDNEINKFYSGIDNLYSGKQKIFYVDPSNIKSFENNLHITSTYYYWITSIMKTFNIDDARVLNKLFLICLSTLILFSVNQTLIRYIFNRRSFFGFTLTSLLTITIQVIMAFIPPILGFHFSSIFALITILLLMDYYSMKETNSFTLIYIGIINFSSIFFSGIFIITNLTLLLSIIVFLVYTKKPFINVFRFYIIVLFLGLTALLWFYNNFGAIVILGTSILITIYSLSNYYTNSYKTFKIEKIFYKNRGTLLLSIFIVLLIVSIIIIGIDPTSYVGRIKNYFTQWYLISPLMFVLFILSTVILITFGTYNIITFKISDKPLNQVSVLFAIHWILFFNPLTINLISIIIIDEILWTQSLIYIATLPVFAYEILSFIKDKIHKKEWTWKNIQESIKNLQKK